MARSVIATIIQANRVFRVKRTASKRFGGVSWTTLLYFCNLQSIRDLPGLESLRHIGLSGFHDEYSLNAVVRTSITLHMRLQSSEMEGENKGIYFSYPCRRRSCSVVNIPAPCVNKMISHIQDVESKIQEYLKQFEMARGEWSIASSTKGATEDWSTTSIAAPEEKVKTEEGDEKCPEIKQEMGTLLSEAIHLIKSLETDRAEAEEALRRQKLRKKKINMKIDSWSIWRLQELPSAVQKEHETYMRDIIELRWHLTDKVHQLKRFEEQKAKLEEANAKVQADVDYMSKHAPLLDSKRNQELEALKECYLKKFEIMELCKRVHEELEEAKENCENAKQKAEEIKVEMDQDLKRVEASLDVYKKEIDKLNSLYRHYSTSIENVNLDIEEKEETVTEALKETKSSTNELATLSRKLEELKRFYDQLTWKKKGYEKEYIDALNTFYATKSTWDIELSNVSKDFSDISKAYTQLLEENKKMEMDVELVVDHINQSIKKKAEHETEIQSLLKLKAQNNELLKQLYREAYQIGAVFHLTKFKTDELDGKIAEVRRKFKGREDFLKKLIRNEVSTSILIQKKMFSLQEVQGQEKKDLINKKILYALALAQLEEPLVELEEEAVRIRSIHQQHSETINDIVEKKNNIRRKVERTKKKLRMKGKKTREALIETEEKRSTIFKEIHDTKSKTSDFQTKINTLNEELILKEQEKKHFDETLDILKDKFVSVRFTKEHAQAVFDQLNSEKRACRERVHEEEERFRVLISMRQKTLEEIKKTQADSLEENLRLAQEYQKIQDHFLAEKEKYFSVYDRQLLSFNASIRDKTQFCQLQRKIHKVWETHFKLVALSSQMRLAKFQTDSQESIQKILAVQEESSDLMQHILAFFQSLTDGSCENDG
ncbi:coiled-coil domain-containing protein 178 [Trichechus manatus latirostris]|uniref:Coiled-coil domain-containing protein 178 n=1 Tax=Trichechus manatus latirostris TaxID=127582 RepID=A0A2Y9E5U6_TRIMA|nr:coiled-coil domain-containing protein 178 [Trichechus manatus latirostris]